MAKLSDLDNDPPPVKRKPTDPVQIARDNIARRRVNPPPEEEEEEIEEEEDDDEPEPEPEPEVRRGRGRPRKDATAPVRTAAPRALRSDDTERAAPPSADVDPAEHADLAAQLVALKAYCKSAGLTIKFSIE